ncbi:hypothetical protein PHPALM_27784 [Phytophthora palmivora]|uniref:Uncharacterized protein n=1 Tax=Phytophthora palmivora TaxID=4796 RepID=A0A2P4XBQ8_9STRA|nr:hypothetical protein PHPALM_27784 [Phytophthora palmivora]
MFISEVYRNVLIYKYMSSILRKRSLEVYPKQGGIVKTLLQRILSWLGDYCNNLDECGLDRKTLPCSKQGLEKICYIDATLVVLIWYLHGRSTDTKQLNYLYCLVAFSFSVLIVKTALLQGISLFKDPTNVLASPVFALAIALLMQTTTCKRLFPPFINNKRRAVCVKDVAELNLVELLDTEEGNTALQAVQKTPAKSRLPGGKAYVNGLLSTAKDIAQPKQENCHLI